MQNICWRNLWMTEIWNSVYSQWEQPNLVHCCCWLGIIKQMYGAPYRNDRVD